MYIDLKIPPNPIAATLYKQFPSPLVFTAEKLFWNSSGIKTWDISPILTVPV